MKWKFIVPLLILVLFSPTFAKPRPRHVPVPLPTPVTQVVVQAAPAVRHTLKADLNGDGCVNMDDLTLFMSEWGECKPMALGPELVVNGGFDDDSVWTWGSGWHWLPTPNDRANFSYNGENGFLLQNIGESAAGKNYRISFTVGFGFLSSAGEDIPTFNLGGVVYEFEGAPFDDTVIELDITTTTDSGDLYFQVFSGFGTSFNIDNVSVMEIIEDEPETGDEAICDIEGSA